MTESNSLEYGIRLGFSPGATSGDLFSHFERRRPSLVKSHCLEVVEKYWLTDMLPLKQVLEGLNPLTSDSLVHVTSIESK